MRLRGTLFLKIYLTIAASLVVAAILLGLAFAIFQDRQETGWGARRDRFVEAMFPPDLDRGGLSRTVEALSAAFDADITVFGADGAPLAASGSPIAFPEGRARRPREAGGEHRLLVIPLPGDRLLAARGAGEFGPPRRNGLLFAMIVAFAIALAAWPVVRHLTRRLEALRSGVTRWGEGEMGLRVAATGTDEVADVARSFNAAAARIEHLIASQRLLIANASHELRSPLARMRMAVELGGEALKPAPRAEIERNLAELDELVGEILLTSRLDHGAAGDEAETFDLLAVAAEEAALGGLAAGGVPAWVSGNRRLVARMVRNLVQNAERHGAPPVAVEVSTSGGVARLVVSDHGAGIAAADRARIFEPFYRPAGHGEGGGGWGLGLALVRQIAERHGGRADYVPPAEGRPGAFTVELPLADHRG